MSAQSRIGLVIISLVLMLILASTPVSAQTGGTVACWGGNIYGGLCSNVPAGLSGVTAIAAGWYHTLALRSDGTVVAWGCTDPSINGGQCTVPAGLSGVTAIAVGTWHSLALKSDGTVVAWGCTITNGGQCNVPAGLSGVAVLAAKHEYSLALKSDGTVVIWGAIVPPPLMSGTITAIAAGSSEFVAILDDGSATDLPYFTGHAAAAKAIAAGQLFSLALKGDGTVAAWGENLVAINVPAGLSGVTAITAGDGHSLALKSNGTVVAWGFNDAGQTNVPAGLSGVKAIAAGPDTSLALKHDGTVVAWGDNYEGQTSVPAGLSGVTAIAAGTYHSVAIRAIPNGATATPYNDPPVAQPDSATATMGTKVTINVLANDSDSDGDPLTVVGVTPASHGKVTINPDNTLTYTPRENFVGADMFYYTISDGRGGTATATVTVERASKN